MRHLRSVNKYFWKYKTRLLLGFVFIVLSNYFRILTPQISGYVVDKVEHSISQHTGNKNVQEKSRTAKYDVLVVELINTIEAANTSFGENVILCGITLLVLAILSGLFMFLMRQTIIVMSRHIEFDQKNEIFKHYQQLDTNFY
ncbi:MAG: ABC transporter, partial [Bacteroidota bacterium]|nr:ABC transporter [Bacteroidota bacterium]